MLVVLLFLTSEAIMAGCHVWINNCRKKKRKKEKTIMQSDSQFIPWIVEWVRECVHDYTYTRVWSRAAPTAVLSSSDRMRAVNVMETMLASSLSNSVDPTSIITPPCSVCARRCERVPFIVYMYSVECCKVFPLNIQISHSHAHTPDTH